MKDKIVVNIELDSLEKDILDIMDKGLKQPIIKQNNNRVVSKDNMVYQQMRKNENESNNFIRLFKENKKEIYKMLINEGFVINCPTCKYHSKNSPLYELNYIKQK